MKLKSILLSALFASTLTTVAQSDYHITIHDTQGTDTIPREIYGQFAEDLGSCVYGGLWVGPDSPIPNVDGYRKDVLQALKDLKVPVLRWPGGCFADTYHWRDGIGPQDKRVPQVNSNWGATMSSNSFGTHEFLNLCELIGCEPYVSMNVGSGTVQEASDWVEYMTARKGPMADLRKANGRTEPWHVKYIGVGNESWGCGGSMRPEYYADLYRRYATFCRDYDGNHLFKIASGASDYDYTWTDVMMQRVGTNMNGLSLHYYTVTGWSGSKGSATDFTADDYYWSLGKCLGIEDVIKKHIAIMDKYDPQRKVGLMVDEWGTWWDEEPGTTPGHLFQQNTMRDALVAALTLDVFHKYTNRIKMTNIAQVVNVLQSMILTNDDKMVLTPSYHVFRLYNVHQNALYLPATIEAPVRSVREQNHSLTSIKLADATASRDKSGRTHVTLTNVDLEKGHQLTVTFDQLKPGKVSAEVLTSSHVNDCNTFESPDLIAPKPFKHFKVKGNTLTVDMPAMSIVALTIE